MLGVGGEGEKKRKSCVNYIAKVNLDYDSDDDDVTAGDHIRHVIRVHNELLTNIYGEGCYSTISKRGRGTSR